MRLITTNLPLWLHPAEPGLEARMGPNVWGQGEMFAFSGWDGPTDWADDFVFCAGPHPFCWTVHGGTPFDFHLEAGGQETLQIHSSEVIASDHLSIVLDAGKGSRLRVRMAFQDRNTVQGSLEVTGAPLDTSLCVSRPQGLGEMRREEGRIRFHGGNRILVAQMQEASVSDATAEPMSLTVTLRKGHPVPFCLSRDPEQKAEIPTLERSFAERATYFNRIPSPPERMLEPNPEDRLRTYLKAASVIKVNLHTPQGAIPYNWSTPDRVPHRHMWLWDSAFHSIGLKHLNFDLARDQIKSVLAHVQNTGFLPHCICPDGRTSSITQPPILAWAAWEIHQAKPDRSFLEFIYPPLKAFLEFLRKERDRDGNGLLEWEDSNASGMDNSPRFDHGPKFDALDLNCFVVQEFQVMSRIADSLGDQAGRESEMWKARAKEMGERINNSLWDEKTGFYYDGPVEGKPSRLKTECGFLPLFAEIASQEQAKCLVEHLRNPDEFWTSFPVPSVARSESTYSRDMWRGPTWLNYNYFIVRGLHRYGYDELAREIAERSIREVTRRYLADGVIFEIYDAESEVSPREMPRKGRVAGPHWINNVIRDYHWSASVFLAFALEEY